MEIRRCYSCMAEMRDGLFCEQCGYDQRTAHAPHQLPAGTVLRGQYLIGRVLGQGGFGITYLGWDATLDIPVAIKEYYPTGLVSRECSFSHTLAVATGNEDPRFAENRERFLREARILARLQDVPEVVQVRNFFAENNTAYIVMGFVEGITLKEHLRRRGGKLPAREALGLLQPLMKALGRVHAAGLVHRDISPDNIMITPEGQVRLIDFGAAHAATAAGDKSTQAVLKHGFAPPEQYQRKGQLGPWTDVYAICATVYNCLTGLVPPTATDRLVGEEDFDWNSIPGLTERQRAALTAGVGLQFGKRTQTMEALCAQLYAEAAAEPVFRGDTPEVSASGTIALGRGEAPAIRTASVEAPVHTAPVDRPVFTAPVEPMAPAKPQGRPGKKKKPWPVLAAVLAVLLLAGAVFLFTGKSDSGPSPSKPDRSEKGSSAEKNPDRDAPKADEPAADAPAADAPAAYKGIITKVALVTDIATIDDNGFNQACWQGVEEWCSDNYIEYTYYQPTEDSDDARILAIYQAVSEGANTVVLPGYLFGAALIEIMDAYPDVYFIAVDVSEGDLTLDYMNYYEPSPNVACLTFAGEQSGYLAGYAAVTEGYTKLGFLGGMAVPAVMRYGYGFVQGADDAAQELGVEIDINFAYAGQFYGSPAITAKMEDWYRHGTEVVFACGGGIYTSVLEAAETYDGRIIGADTDQSWISMQFLTSAIKRMDSATETLLDELHRGNWENYGGTCTNLNLSMGEFVGLPVDSWHMVHFTVEEYYDVLARLADGKVVVSDDTLTMPTVSGNTTVYELS